MKMRLKRPKPNATDGSPYEYLKHCENIAKIIASTRKGDTREVISGLIEQYFEYTNATTEPVLEVVDSECQNKDIIEYRKRGYIPLEKPIENDKVP